MKVPINIGSMLHISINDWESKKRQISQFISDYERNELPNGYSKFDSDRPNANYLNEFMHIFDDELQHFGQEYKLSSFNIESVWSVRYHKGDYHSPHTHGTSNFSGVIYLDYDSEVHSSTQFITEQVNPITNSTIITNLNVKEGDLVIFPANMLHFTLPNNSDKNRIIMSFDISIGKQVAVDSDRGY